MKSTKGRRFLPLLRCCRVVLLRVCSVVLLWPSPVVDSLCCLRFNDFSEHVLQRDDSDGLLACMRVADVHAMDALSDESANHLTKGLKDTAQRRAGKHQAGL